MGTTPSEAHPLYPKEERQEIFSGRLLRVVVDEVNSPDGSHFNRELVFHPRAVAIMPILPNGRILLVQQYRHAVETSLWEIPAGLLELEETPIACAQRELLEETGYEAKQWEERLSFYTSPGFTNEEVTLFFAHDLVKTADPLPEEITVCNAFTPDELFTLIKSGHIKDAKTILALELLGRQAS
jgi:ADP-ribose pyrophosphatase